MLMSSLPERSLTIIDDPRLKEVKKYKQQRQLQHLSEVSAIFTELVDERINENSKYSRICCAIISIEIGIEQLNSKMDRKLPKEKTKFNPKIKRSYGQTLFLFF